MGVAPPCNVTNNDCVLLSFILQQPCTLIKLRYFPDWGPYNSHKGSKTIGKMLTYLRVWTEIHLTYLRGMKDITLVLYLSVVNKLAVLQILASGPIQFNGLKFHVATDIWETGLCKMSGVSREIETGSMAVAKCFGFMTTVCVSL
jgi:hypothetical protein